MDIVKSQLGRPALYRDWATSWQATKFSIVCIWLSSVDHKNSGGWGILEGNDELMPAGVKQPGLYTSITESSSETNGLPWVSVERTSPKMSLMAARASSSVKYWPWAFKSQPRVVPHQPWIRGSSVKLVKAGWWISRWYQDHYKNRLFGTHIFVFNEKKHGVTRVRMY